MADAIPAVAYRDFLFNREPLNTPHSPALIAALGFQMDLQELAHLAQNDDPRVRTLALLRLFAMEDQAALPVIHRRLEDDGETFPEAHPGSRGDGRVETKVRDVAKSMLEQVGYRSQAPFDQWAAPRMGNPDWLDWQMFHFRRIAQHDRPPPADINSRIETFRHRIVPLSPRARAWLSIMIADEALSVRALSPLAPTDQEIIEMAREIGPDALLEFLEHGTRAGLREPGIDARGTGRRALLPHAKQLFRKQDSEALYKLRFRVAAADANPEMASIYLREAAEIAERDKSPQSLAMAMAAMLDLAGEQERYFVANWFHQVEGHPYSNPQIMFIREYQRRAPQDWKHALLPIVAHPDFDRLTGQVFREFSRMLGTMTSGDERPSVASLGTGDSERNKLRAYFDLPEIPRKQLELNIERRLGFDREIRFDETDGRVSMFAVDPWGNRIAVGMPSGELLLLDASNGEIISRFFVFDPILAIEFQQSDGTLWIATHDSISRWSTLHNRQLEHVKTTEPIASHSLIAPNGEWLVTMDRNEKHLLQIGLKDGQVRWSSPLRISPQGVLAVAPDSSRIVVADESGRRMRLYQADSAEPVAILSGHAGVPRRVMFSPDSKTMVTTGGDDKILFWNAEDGRLMHQFHTNASWPEVFGFTRDARFLIVRAFGRDLGMMNLETRKARVALVDNPHEVRQLITRDQRIWGLCGHLPGSVRIIEWNPSLWTDPSEF
ncbi:MAG: WD40 repeat domain-containing protein [Luteolibacter sp.]